MLSENNNICNEEEFIAKLKDGDMPCFSILYDKYSGALYSIVLQIVLDRELTNEVLQDVFVRIWQKMESYDASKGRLFTWMSIIARNLAIDMIRSGHRHDARKTDGNAIGLRKIVNKLKPRHQALIDLAYFKGYTHVQIAALKKIPLSTVKTRLKSAMGELKVYLVQNESGGVASSGGVGPSSV
jgi:DNA-directed RNA polymerase specialized sigma24 family protein